MVMDIFDSLLTELSKELDIPDLKPDSNSSCLIVLPNDGPEVQLEIDPTGNYLVMGSLVGFVPIGRYRESVFKEALRANGLPGKINGSFAYSKQKDQLLMFDKLPVKDLTGAKIAAAFEPFVEKAQHWKESIAKGEIPSILGSFSTRKAGGGMFGL